MNWEALSAISTVVGSTTLLITAVFAVMQLNELRRSRKLELMIKLFDELASQEARAQRVFIYAQLPNDPAQTTSDHFLVIDEVLAKLDMIWLLIDQGQLDRRYVFDAYGEIFIKLWQKLSPIVDYERGRRGAYYRQRTEALVGQVKRYFQAEGRPLEYPLYTPETHDTQLGNQVRQEARESCNASLAAKR
jgi:hypothetical protein